MILVPIPPIRSRIAQNFKRLWVLRMMTSTINSVMSSSRYPNNPFNNGRRASSSSSSCMMVSSCSLHSVTPRPQAPVLRYAVLGAGFAGLSVVWHLLQHSSKNSRICIDIYDEVGIGGGASGVSGGLLHPYSPKAKLLWRGAECWKECLKLLSIAETAADSTEDTQELESYVDKSIVWRRGILRPATNMKTLDILKENAQNCHQSCRIESIDKDVAQNLVPNLSVPFNSAIYIPQAVNIHPQRYLQALFLACKNLVKDLAVSGYEGNEINFYKKSINSLLELAEEYNAVIICLGAKADMVQELTGKLPLRTCRGVVAHLQLPNDRGEEYRARSPSILSGAWLAVQGPRNLVLGSTWDWTSRNYSPNVSAEECSMALEELLPKASIVYPGIKNWAFTLARGGVRAMPPLSPSGSIPLLGCVDNIIGMKKNNRCKYWLFGGLGARGLLYHGWLGKLLAQAVLSCNEDVLPPELTLWKQMK